MQELFFTVNAIFPMIIIIALGYFLKVKGLFNDAVIKALNKFVFMIAIPVLIFYNIYNMESFEVDLNLAIFLISVLLISFLIGIIFTNKFKTNRENKSIILQTFYRTNATTLGLQVILLMPISNAANANLIAMTGIAIAMFNALGVISFQIYDGETSKINVSDLIMKVIKNPIIIAIFIGFLFQFIRSFTQLEILKNNFNSLYKAVGQVSLISSPLALIALGASFDFKLLNELKKEVFTGVLIRSLIVPTIVFFIAIIFRNFFGFNQDHFPALVAVIVPSLAVTVSPMADSMNANTKLAAQIIVWSTIFSIFTMFIIIFILKAMALI